MKDPPPMIWIGTTGFAYSHWNQIFYPPATPDRLSYYAQHASLNELNSTFYKIPPIPVVQGWYRKTPSDFIFTAKMVRNITHMSQYKVKPSILKAFFSALNHLQAKLHIVIFQFPPFFQQNSRTHRYLLETLDHSEGLFEGKIFVEVRHASWFTDTLRDELLSRAVSFVNTNRWRIPESYLPQKGYYLRLLGDRKRIPDDAMGKIRLPKQEELQHWVTHLVRLNPIYQSIWVVINNRFSGNAIADAIYLAQLLREQEIPTRGFDKPLKGASRQQALDQFF
ncbi:MAG: DUF72 domain-containing protein [Candidatus Hodarchaeota archaeon]